MPNIIVPRPVLEQPRMITRINRSHWMARGLKVLYNPAAGSVNLVTGRQPIALTAVPTLVSKDGYLMNREGAMQFDVIVPPPLTIHTITIFDGSGISDRIGGVNGSGSGWRYETNSNTVQFTFGGVANYGSGAILTDAADYDVRAFGVTTVVTGTAGADIRFFGNGKFVSNLTTGTYVPSSTNFDCGDATGAILLLWDHAKSDAEVAAIHANPWQVIESYTEVYFPAAAGFQPAWAVKAMQTIQSRLAA